MKLLLEEQDKRQLKARQIKEQLKESGGKLYIWGKGIYARILAGYLKEEAVEASPIWVLDDLYFTEKDRADSVSVSDLIRDYSPSDVVVFGIYDYGKYVRLKEQYRDRLVHFYDLHFVVVYNTIVKWSPDFVRDKLALYEESFDMLCDEKSKKTMEAYLNATTVGAFDELYLDCREETAYFNELTKDLKIDRLIDCGAFDGDSIHDFIAAFPAYKGITAFEPDKKNVEKIREREKKENIHDLTVIDKGVYSETTTLFFREEGKSSSHLSDSGSIKVDVTRMDEMEFPQDERMLLKIDIEGSEMEALKGAEEFIRRNHPCLTICVYHKQEDLITIPQFIHSLDTENVYDHYLRYHGTDLAELVFYAIPKGWK
ncbi:MAG: FkbM family methyltransferase [Lachnospiraceae bacterium]|nr:FkbM family methyltransferase [Lachnospiraceae bacterium]